MEDEKEYYLLPPYYVVLYIDYDGKTHMATIKDLTYLQYLKENYLIKQCNYIES
jgi:hypothetical protein